MTRMAQMTAWLPLRLVRRAPKWSDLLTELHGQEADEAVKALERGDREAVDRHRFRMQGIAAALRFLADRM